MALASLLFVRIYRKTTRPEDHPATITHIGRNRPERTITAHDARRCGLGESAAHASIAQLRLAIAAHADIEVPGTCR